MAGLHDTRFGCVTRHATSREDWEQRVRTIEGWGFDVLLSADHLGNWPPFLPLVAAATVSSRLRFGVQVLNNEFWNPALLAREAAVADVLTSGRLELGFGAGHNEAEFRAAGLPYPPPGERVARMAAAIPLVQRLLAGETVTSGAPYHLDQCVVGVAPAQSPVPVIVGGNGDRVLAAAARHADIVSLVGFTSGTERVHTNLTHFTWDGLAERLAYVRSVAPERYDALERSVLVQVVIVTDDRAATVAETAKAFGVSPELAFDSPFVMIGSVAHLLEHLVRLRELGVTYPTTFEPYGAALAEVIRAHRG